MPMLTKIIVVSLAAAAWAVYKGDLAAVYVALGLGFIVVILDAIEFKLNKLLDHHDIRVSDLEISQH